MKRWMAIFLAFTLVVTGCSISAGGIKVHAEEFREGYQLRPTKENPTGVSIDSSFILSAQAGEQISRDWVQEQLQITPHTEFEVVSLDRGLEIRPKTPLRENTVYAFALEGRTWLWQSESEFYLQAVMPAHQATQVPIDTGIEFLFSVKGATDLDKYIEISPKVEGRFESRDKLVVFVPRTRLAKKTIYTVKVKAGLPLENSAKSLKEDRVFQFETADKTSIFGENTDYEYLDFQTWQNEIASGDKPIFLMSYYNANRERTTTQVKVDIYQYQDALAYIQALSQTAKTPTWADYVDGRVATKNLNKVMTADVPMVYDQDMWGYRLEVPAQLKAGYYVVEAQKNKAVSQTFLQVTDISTYYQATDMEDLVWVHQVKSGNLLVGAEITSYQTLDREGKASKPQVIEKTTSDQDGLALLRESSQGDVALVISSGQMEGVMYCRDWNYGPYYWRRHFYGQTRNAYWQTLQLDRGLYQPQDQVKLFGFVMPRYQEGSNRVLDKGQRQKMTDQLKEVRVEVVKDHWYYYVGSDQALALVQRDLPIKDGFYTGQVDLPNLAPGRYQLVVKLGDEVLESTYFKVEEYVKPAYKIEVTKPQKAIFWNESMDFTVKTQFFEGTPVSYLDYHYSIYSDSNPVSDQGKTGQDGQAKISFRPQPSQDFHLVDYAQISVSAHLPESGEITGQDHFRVFLRNVNLEAEGDLKQGKASLQGDIYKISLDRLNNGTGQDDWDYKDGPVAGHKLNLELYKNQWVKNEIGQYYDYINKVVVKRYEWHSQKTLVDKQVLTSDDQGKFTYQTDLKEEEDVYYTAELTSQDLAGQPIKDHVYFWDRTKWWHNYGEGEDDRISLVSDQDQYKIGDLAQIRLMQGKKEADLGKVLYISGQKGYRQAWLAGSQTSLPFTDQDVPQLFLKAVRFGGYAAEEVASTVLEYDTDQKQLVIRATPDQATYKPGETVKLLVEVKDLGGRPAKEGKVLVKAVDEALLALADHEDNPLEDLYRRLGSGFGRSQSSHSLQEKFIRSSREGDAAVAEANVETKSEAPSMLMKEKSPQAEASPRVRSNFQDTALFQLVDLDAKGKATLAFAMPDNITAWRLMMTALSQDLEVGSHVHNLNVSLPFFISPVMNSRYLEGDQVDIGISAYGSSLRPDSQIEYKVFLDNQQVGVKSGPAFTRLSIPLPVFAQNGDKVLKIEARTDQGLADAVEHKLQVVASQHEKIVSQTLAAQEGMTLKSNDRGLTTVYLIDREKSAYLPELYHMNYYYGDRIDQRMVAKLAGDLLKEIQGKDTYVNGLEDIKLSDYQTESGGLSVLPYSEADLEITAQMLPLLVDPVDEAKDYVNRQLLGLYLQAQLENDLSRDKGAALYGLALLRRPILEALRAYSQIENLSLKERIYLGLAYAQLGDTFKAKQIYSQYVEPQVESFDQIAFVKGANKDDSYRLTANAMVLAQALGHSHGAKMFRYQKDNYSTIFFTGGQKMNYLKSQLTKLSLADSKLAYSYLGQDRQVDLEAYPVALEIPSSQLEKLKITQVRGNVDVILTYARPEKLESSADAYLTLNRKYYVDSQERTEFKEGDIVEVRIQWDIKDQAPEGQYRITDFVPAGLKPIQNDFSIGRRYSSHHWWWKDIEGQKVTVYVHKWEDARPQDRVFSYYARIVSGGQFKAQGALIQGVDNLDILVVSPDQTIKINQWLVAGWA